jgi:CDP-2,3-bis-(O-geranylgeranyl)-sn-glycerol synthase
MDFGRNWPGDGRRILGPSKTWSGFLFGATLAVPFGLLEAGLILAAPPNLQLVPRWAPSIVSAIPIVALVTYGAMAGDALGSFLKRRLGRPSGARAFVLDQLPFVAVPILAGAAVDPGLFVSVFGSWEALLWLLVFTFGLHAVFNWIGFHAGVKKVPW